MRNNKYKHRDDKETSKTLRVKSMLDFPNGPVCDWRTRQLGTSSWHNSFTTDSEQLEGFLQYVIL